jgi:hypothetical protein
MLHKGLQMGAHYSPGLKQVIREVSNFNKPKILDLGSSNKNVIQLFAKQKSLLFFEDLPELLFANSAHSDPSDIHKQLSSYLLDYGDIKFDIVLAWDLFNYLELSTVKLLMEKINHHCRPDTLLHMLRYTGSRIPIQPRRFQATSSGILNYLEGDLRPRLVPTHSTVRLLQHMTDQFMESTVINEAGMQENFVEHILRYKPTKHRKSVVMHQQSKNVDAVNRGYISPALETVYQHLATIDQPRVLVFGNQPRNYYHYLSTVSSDIYIDDVYNTLRWRSSDNGHAEQTFSTDLLNYPRSVRFDAILCWDLFNYCDSAQIERIGTLISQYCHTDSMLLIFSYTRSSIPETPCSFAIDSNGNIRAMNKGHSINRKGNITASALMKLLSNFYVENTYVNQFNMIGGVCEYLFTYSPFNPSLVPKKQNQPSALTLAKQESAQMPHVNYIEKLAHLAKA